MSQSEPAGKEEGRSFGALLCRNVAVCYLRLGLPAGMYVLDLQTETACSLLSVRLSVHALTLPVFSLTGVQFW